MSEDNMQNDDFNPNEIPSDGNINDINPSENISDGDISASEVPEGQTDAQNYDFAQMDDEISSQNSEPNEVHIDPSMHEKEPVTVRPLEFTPFDSYTPTDTDTNKNLELLMDIKLELTVELGRCQLPVKKVLELTRGSIIELDKIAGESVELYANGKHIANGEVVVIEDNFGLRITSITEPQERIKNL